MTNKNKQPAGDVSEPRLQLELNQLRRKLTLFADLSKRLAATLDPIALLDEVVSAACQITDAQYGALGVFEIDGNIEQFIVHGISDEQRQAIGDLPVGRGLLGLLQSSQEPIRLADLGKHAASVGFPANHPPMKSFLGAPVRYEGQPLGNLYLTEKHGGGEFTDEDESMLLLLADQAAMAIHNASLHAAAEYERARLRTLVETSPVGVLVVRKGEGEVRMVNREAARLLGGAQLTLPWRKAGHQGPPVPGTTTRLRKRQTWQRVLARHHRRHSAVRPEEGAPLNGALKRRAYTR